LLAIKRGDYVFPSWNADRHASPALLVHVMERLRRHGTVTVHGYRSSFADYARERTAAAHEVIELSLAHRIGPAVVRAYSRSDLFEKRAALMQQWADFCSTPMADNVVTLGAAS
jgi:hypothetical protein